MSVKLLEDGNLNAIVGFNQFSVLFLQQGINLVHLVFGATDIHNVTLGSCIRERDADFWELLSHLLHTITFCPND